MIRFIPLHILTLALLSSSPSFAVESTEVQEKAGGKGGPTYTIQIGAFADKKNAEDLTDKLQAKGIKAFYFSRDTGIHVVQFGNYTSRRKAGATAGRLVATGVIDKYFITSAGKIASDKPGEHGLQSQPPEGADGAKKKARIHTTQELAERYRAQAINSVFKPHHQPTLLDNNKRAPTANRTSNIPRFLGETGIIQRAQSALIQTTSGLHGEISQRKQEWRIFDESAEPPAKTPTLPRGGQLLGKGWENFNAGNYDEAISIFTFALPLNDVSIEATYGLASCYTAQEKPAKALPLFETLVQKRYQLKDTLPELLNLLLETGDYKKAVDYAALFDEKDRDPWQRRIDQALFSQKFRIVKKSADMQNYDSFVAEYDGNLKQCRMEDTFNEIASFFVEKKKPEQAVAIYRTLLSCSKDQDFRIGILYSLKPLIPPRDLLAMFELEKSSAADSTKYRKKLNDFKVVLLYSLLETEPDKVKEHAGAILEIYPGDRTALSAMGWHYFKNNLYSESYTYFSLLNRTLPGQTENVTGLIYTLLEMKEFEKALKLVNAHSEDAKIAGLQKEIRLRILWKKVSGLASGSPELEEVAAEILTLKPEDEAIRVILAWGYYSGDRYEKAYQEFLKLYNDKPLEKGYAYGLVSSLRKLERYDEAIELAIKNKEHDEELATVEMEIYLERARAAYEQKRYKEAELYFKKVLDAEPDDEDSKTLLESSIYRQTRISKILTPIVGLSGSSYGSFFHDLQGSTGTGVSALLNQGIDWVKLPGNVLLRTYGELWYRTRSEDFKYYDLVGYSLGLELQKSIFRLGSEYVTERYTTQNKSNAGPQIFLGWYKDWFKYMYDGGEDASWFNIQSLSGSTYGKLSHDLGGITGTAVSGNIRQGIDWLKLPGNTMLSSFVEYRYSFRTGDNVYFNEHGPAFGTELQKRPFTLGIDYYLEHDPERHLLNHRATLYLKWYYNWDLKSNK